MRVRLDLEDNGGVGGLRDHHIVQDTAVIGRSGDCDWQLDCGERLVSRRHAFISREGDVFVVYDASANGLYVNGAAEPLGEGQRVQLSQGDRLRIGPFTVTANILDAPQQAVASDAPGPPDPSGEPAPSEPVETGQTGGSNNPDTTPHDPFDEGGLASGVPAAPTTLTRSLDLGETRDAFQPPSVTIPEDWDLDVDGDTGDEGDGAAPDLNRHLDVLEPDIMRGLLEGLNLQDEVGEPPELTRKQAYALGASLRDSLTALILLRSEFDKMERDLPVTADPPVLTDEVQRRVDAVLQRLFREGNAQALEELEQVQELADTLPARPRRFAVALNEAAKASVSVFRPAGFEERARKAVEEARERSEWFRWVWGRSLLKLVPEVPYWRAYRRWYSERGDTAQGVVQTLFEKSLKRFILQAKSKGSRSRSGRNSSG